MDSNENILCQICLEKPSNQDLIVLKCQHTFCKPCLKKYIFALKAYRQLTPSKLQCLHQNCQEEIQDHILLSTFPGQQGFILKTIKKCYKQAKNPNSIIFSCNGIFKTDRKALIQKGPNMTRQEHSRLTNDLVKKLRSGAQVMNDMKLCNNIHIFNKVVQQKEKTMQCYLCGCSYCVQCFDLTHYGPCQIKKEDPMLNLKKVKTSDNFEEFITAHQMRRCLNPKCTIPIEKQEGCYWVKCRCSWQICYPCGVLWGNCEHFSRYPYQKFTPPSEWLVKALNLY